MYVVNERLRSPKPSNMSSKSSTNINYITHNIFMNFGKKRYISTTQVDNNKSIYMFDCDFGYVKDTKVSCMM